MDLNCLGGVSADDTGGEIVELMLFIASRH